MNSIYSSCMQKPAGIPVYNIDKTLFQPEYTLHNGSGKEYYRTNRAFTDVSAPFIFFNNMLFCLLLYFWPRIKPTL